MLACLHFCSAALLVRFPFFLRDGAGVLSRVAFMDDNGYVMLGKVINCEKKEDAGAGAKQVRELHDFLC